MMHMCWRNPCSKVTEDILVGDTIFRIIGLYDDGDRSTDDRETAPLKPSFEIESINMLVETNQGTVQLNITKLLEDVNTMTWRRECNNDLFEYFSDKMVEKCKDEL